jgi:hypothetical protein
MQNASALHVGIWLVRNIVASSMIYRSLQTAVTMVLAFASGNTYTPHPEQSFKGQSLTVWIILSTENSAFEQEYDGRPS